MTDKAIQDYYPEDVAICYGCGRNNPHGLHLKTHWNGKQGVMRFTPRSYHTAFPGVVYGGLIASLIDCHSTGTAAAAAYHAEGREPGTQPEITFVTANLNVSYLKPTPIGTELVLRSQPKELTENKAIIACSVYANGEECAQGEVVVVRVRERRGVHLGENK
ncbi:MAG: PaaI family thioesterase [Deltaproteobacteria bacterium]|nr:PaaI family thioesterase [Deltaproteobacteria bacterium]